MKDEQDKDEEQTRGPAKNPKKAQRQDRLKQALRENLKRRKSQARGRSDVTIAPSNGDDVAPRGIGGKKPGE
jgi:hypothetical protein